MVHSSTIVELVRVVVVELRVVVRVVVVVVLAVVAVEKKSKQQNGALERQKKFSMIGFLTQTSRTGSKAQRDGKTHANKIITTLIP